MSAGTFSSAPALQVENLVKVFPARGRRPEVRAVDDLSFHVRQGEIFGLLGPNGAGKTTTIRMLTTLLSPTSGQASVLGHNVVREPLEVRRRIAVVLQEHANEQFLTTQENLVTFGRFHGFPLSEARRRADEVLEKFQLTEYARRKVQDLSGGLKRRVQVSKVFMIEAPVVFLDEFSSGMDPLLKRTVMGYLAEEAGRGRTIILTTQVLSEAEELCDDILILHRGRKLVQGSLRDLKLLSKDIYDVSLAFEQLPEKIREEREAFQPQRLAIEQDSVEMTVQAPETRVLEMVAGLARRGRLLHVEINGASLEDIFVSLTGEEES
jgi:ABC-2 type transport system ATP-binding protein